MPGSAAEHLVTREAVLAALHAHLEPLPYVHAMWEGGAAGFSRIGQRSGVDLQVDADNGRVADTFQAIEGVLKVLSAIDLDYELPRPAWHGHAQTFYRLRHASPFLLLDLVVMKHSSQCRRPPTGGQPPGSYPPGTTPPEGIAS